MADENGPLNYGEHYIIDVSGNGLGDYTAVVKPALNYSFGQITGTVDVFKTLNILDLELTYDANQTYEGSNFLSHIWRSLNNQYLAGQEAPSLNGYPRIVNEGVEYPIQNAGVYTLQALLVDGSGYRFFNDGKFYVTILPAEAELKAELKGDSIH